MVFLAISQKDTPHAAFTQLASHCPTVIVTCGKDGALIQHEEKQLHVPAYTNNIQVVDSTGAGDTFTGVLLGGLALGCSIEKAAQGAARLPAAIVSQAGARLPASAAQVWQEAVEAEQRNAFSRIHLALVVAAILKGYQQWSDLSRKRAESQLASFLNSALRPYKSKHDRKLQ